MTMRTRAVVAVSVVAVVGFFAGTAAMLPSAESAETTPTESSTSGGCLPPSLGADLWTGAFPESLGPLEDRNRDCDILCHTHVRRCRHIVHLSRSCNSGFAGAVGQLSVDVCNTLDNRSDRRSCRRGAHGFRQELRRCIRADALYARGCCETNFQTCWNSCTDTKGPDIQLCFTSGACLFDFGVNATF